VVIAAGPIAVLGIGHPAAHLLVLGVLGAFGWLAVRPHPSWARLVRALELRWPGAGRVWIWIVAAGVTSALIKWWLDDGWLNGRGGIEFYQLLLREQGVTDAGGSVRWSLLAALAPVLFVVILIDGMFFSGLIQRRIATHTNLHAGVHTQAVLFGLPHAFAGPAPDPLYGFFTYLAGVAYGYVYARTRTHWIPAALLWLHVLTVWLLLLGA
jgi:membrane protease YdiL (CAAX protease family)